MLMTPISMGILHLAVACTSTRSVDSSVQFLLESRTLLSVTTTATWSVHSSFQFALNVRSLLSVTTTATWSVDSLLYILLRMLHTAVGVNTDLTGNRRQLDFWHWTALCQSAQDLEPYIAVARVQSYVVLGQDLLLSVYVTLRHWVFRN
jgi:hypothetical protein